MSSVDASSKSKNNDEVRRAREDYQGRESKLVKNQQKKIRSINESHQKELENLKKSYNEQLKQVNNRLRDQISMRENRHKDEVNKIKTLHQQSLKEVAQSSDGKVDAYENKFKGEVQRNETKYESRLKDLEFRYEQELSKKQREHESSIRNVKDSQDRFIQRNRKNIKDQHQEELATVRNDRAREVGGLQTELTEERRTSRAKIKNQELQHFSDKNRMTQNFFDQMNRERVDRRDSETELRSGFKESVESIRVKQDEARKGDRADALGALKKMERNVSNRLSNRLRSLEKRHEDLKHEKNKAIVKTERLASKHERNLISSYENRVDDYKRQNDEVREEMNERLRTDINKLKQEGNDSMQFSNRFHRERAQMQDERTKMSLKELKSNYETKSMHEKSQASLRVEKLKNAYEGNLRKINQIYDKAISEIKTKNSEEKNEIRSKLTEEKRQTILRMKDQVQSSDIKNREKNVRIIQEYKTKIEGLKNQSYAEKKEAEKTKKRVVEDLKKNHKVQLETVKSQYDEKLEEVTKHNSHEITNLKTRHRTEMNNVLSVVKNQKS